MSAVKIPVRGDDDVIVAVPVRKLQAVSLLPSVQPVSSVPSLRPPLDQDCLPVLTEVIEEGFVLLQRPVRRPAA
jgi:hypothetical protein